MLHWLPVYTADCFWLDSATDISWQPIQALLKCLRHILGFNSVTFSKSQLWKWLTAIKNLRGPLHTTSMMDSQIAAAAQFRTEQTWLKAERCVLWEQLQDVFGTYCGIAVAVLYSNHCFPAGQTETPRNDSISPVASLLPSFPLARGTGV